MATARSASAVRSKARIGGNACHALADEDSKRKVVALGGLGAFDLAEANADGLGARADDDGVGGVSACLFRQIDQLTCAGKKCRGIDFRGHDLAFPSRSIYCALLKASRPWMPILFLAACLPRHRKK